MKIKAVNPGKVFLVKNKWHFSFDVVDGFNRRQEIESWMAFDTASMAKQAMREKVHHERIRNGLI